MVKNRIIETVEELDQFMKFPTKFTNEISMNFSIFSNDENYYLSKQISKYRNACGCKTGTIFMVISILVSIIYLIENFSVFKKHLLVELVYCFIFIFLCSIFGKLVGLVISRIKMKSLLISTRKNIVHQMYLQERV